MKVAGPTAMTKATAPTQPKDLRLEKACTDFEAVFLTMLWRAMEKSSGTDLGNWGVFADQAIGQSWAKSGGIGLAKVIYKSMSKHLST